MPAAPGRENSIHNGLRLFPSKLGQKVPARDTVGMKGLGSQREGALENQRRLLGTSARGKSEWAAAGCRREKVKSLSARCLLPFRMALPLAVSWKTAWSRILVKASPCLKWYFSEEICIPRRS